MSLAPALLLLLLISRSDALSTPADEPASADAAEVAALTPPPPDPHLYCRPEVIESFANLYAQSERLNSRSGDRAIELATQIVPEGAGFKFENSGPPQAGEDGCRTVTRAPGMIAMAHTHPKDKVQPEPSGVDCDSRFPNFILADRAIYETIPRQSGESLYGKTGDPNDRGRYRRIYSGNWRQDRRRSDWEERCRSSAEQREQAAEENPPDYPRCLRNNDTEAAVRRDRSPCR